MNQCLSLHPDQECELFEKPTSDRAKPVVDWTLERVANLLVTSYCKNRERLGMLSVVGTIQKTRR